LTYGEQQQRRCFLSLTVRQHSLLDTDRVRRHLLSVVELATLIHSWSHDHQFNNSDVYWTDDHKNNHLQNKKELISCWDGRPFGHDRQGPKSGGCCAHFCGREAGSPSNTMSTKSL